MSECEHQYVYLRQEKKNEGYERNPHWVYYDVFYCERCLTYSSKSVRATRPATDHFGEVEAYDPKVKAY